MKRAPLPGFFGRTDQLPVLPAGHRYRQEHNSEYLLDIPASLKALDSRKLTVEEAMFLVGAGYDLAVDVFGRPIASKAGHHSYNDALHLLDKLKKKAS